MTFALNQPNNGDTNWGGAVNNNFLQLQNILSNVAQTADVTTRSTSSTTYVDSGVSVALPRALSSSTNKVLIRVTISSSCSNISTPRYTLFRGGVNITPSGRDCLGFAAIPQARYMTNVCFDFLDSPGAVAVQLYSIYWKADVGTAFMGNNGVDLAYTAPTIMIAQEIPA